MLPPRATSTRSSSPNASPTRGDVAGSRGGGWHIMSSLLSSEKPQHPKTASSWLLDDPRNRRQSYKTKPSNTSNSNTASNTTRNSYTTNSINIICKLLSNNPNITNKRKMRMISLKVSLYFVSFIIPFLLAIISLRKLYEIRLGQIHDIPISNQRMQQLNYNSKNYVPNNKVNNNLPNAFAITNGATAKQLLRKSKVDNGVVPKASAFTATMDSRIDNKNDVQQQDRPIVPSVEQNSNVRQERLSSGTPAIDNANNGNKINLYIPKQFLGDAMLLSKNDPKRRSFPRWDFDNNGNNNVPIIDSMIDFIQQESEHFQPYVENEDTWFAVSRYNPVHTSDHIDEYTPNWWFPEALYIVDFSTLTTQATTTNGQGRIYASQTARSLSNHGGTGAIQYKYEPTEQLMKMAMNIFASSSFGQQQKSQQHPWPRLYELLIQKKGSFPFLAHFSDFIGCNYNNWGPSNSKQSIPLFTVAASVECNHTIPFPTYQMYLNAFENKGAWKDKMEQHYAAAYPKFEEKINQVVWRGSLTGVMPEFDVSQRGPRYHLTKLVHNEDLLTEKQRNLFDVKLTHIPDDAKCTKYINGTELGGISKTHNMKMFDFQNYKAILDVDGFSWSSRYSDLLCYNSVILKIEPQYVDYFYYPSNNTNRRDDGDDYTLLPWKQYIPVKFDLSDLVEKTEYALDRKNEKHVQQIIRNANDWCMNKNTRESLGRDVLDIWEKYVTILDQSSSLSSSRTSSSINNINHREQKQQQVKGRVLDSSSRTNSNHNMHWEERWNQVKGGIMSSSLQMIAL